MADVNFTTELNQLAEETQQIQRFVDQIRAGADTDWVGDVITDFEQYLYKTDMLENHGIDEAIAKHNEHLKTFIDAYFEPTGHPAAFRRDLRTKFEQEGYNELASFRLRHSLDPQVRKQVNQFFTDHARLESQIKMSELECSVFRSFKCALTIFVNDPDVANESIYLLGRGYANRIYVMAPDE